MAAVRLAAAAALAATLAALAAAAALAALAAPAAAAAGREAALLVLLPVHRSYQLEGPQLYGGHHRVHLYSSRCLLCLPLPQLRPRRLHLGVPRLARVDAGLSGGSKSTATATAGWRQISTWHNWGWHGCIPTVSVSARWFHTYASGVNQEGKTRSCTAGRVECMRIRRVLKRVTRLSTCDETVYACVDEAWKARVC